MEKTDLRVGRVFRALEDELGLSLCIDVGLYIDETGLSRLCLDNPSGYLASVERIKEMARRPDFISLGLKQEISLAKVCLFDDGVGLAKATFALKGRPKRYCLSEYSLLGRVKAVGLRPFPCQGRRAAHQAARRRAGKAASRP